MIDIIFWTIQIFLVPALSPLFIGIIRKTKAKFQNRQGASVFQFYSDLWKLFHKDEVISRDASWIFRFAPYLIFAITLLVGASIPLFSLVFHNVLSDFLVIVYLLVLGTFFTALAGIDTGGGFGGFGSSREMTIAVLAEGGVIFSFAALAVLAGSTNLFAIAGAVSGLTIISLAPVLPAFFGFVIALLAENARYPFDNPSTHLELTMIHEAMILEYSGKRLALVEWAAANKFFIFAAMGMNLFFPWGLGSSPDLSGAGLGFVLLLAKVLSISIFVAVLESSIAKYRYFRLPDLLLISMILGAIAMSLIL